MGVYKIWCVVLMCLDIPCGDCTGNVQKQKLITVVQERKRERKSRKARTAPKKSFCNFLGGQGLPLEFFKLHALLISFANKTYTYTFRFFSPTLLKFPELF